MTVKRRGQELLLLCSLIVVTFHIVLRSRAASTQEVLTLRNQGRRLLVVVAGLRAGSPVARSLIIDSDV